MARAHLLLGFSSCALIGALVASNARAQEAAPAPADPAAPAAPAAADPAAAPAAADPAAAPPSDTAAPAGEAAAPGAGVAAPGADPQADQVADAQAGNSPAELPGQTYRFIGARYRGIVMPKFMMNLFSEGGDTVYIHAFGPEFAIRKNGFEYNLSAWWGLYKMDDTAFKGKDDPVTAWELVKSDLNVIFLSSDFLWTHDFSPEFGLNYGLGAGIGFVIGDLFRTQSYPTVDGQDPNDYSKCTGLATPLESEQFGHFCDEENEHWAGYKEPSWANGGSKPIVFPWLVLQTGLRFKPHRNFAGRLDLGFGTSGFFFGVGADYGL